MCERSSCSDVPDPIKEEEQEEKKQEEGDYELSENSSHPWAAVFRVTRYAQAWMAQIIFEGVNAFITTPLYPVTQGRDPRTISQLTVVLLDPEIPWAYTLSVLQALADLPSPVRDDSPIVAVFNGDKHRTSEILAHIEKITAACNENTNDAKKTALFRGRLFLPLVPLFIDLTSLGIHSLQEAMVMACREGVGSPWLNRAFLSSREKEIQAHMHWLSEYRPQAWVLSYDQTRAIFDARFTPSETIYSGERADPSTAPVLDECELSNADFQFGWRAIRENQAAYASPAVARTVDDLHAIASLIQDRIDEIHSGFEATTNEMWSHIRHPKYTVVGNGDYLSNASRFSWTLASTGVLVDMITRVRIIVQRKLEQRRLDFLGEIESLFTMFLRAIVGEKNTCPCVSRTAKQALAIQEEPSCPLPIVNLFLSEGIVGLVISTLTNVAKGELKIFAGESDGVVIHGFGALEFLGSKLQVWSKLQMAGVTECAAMYLQITTPPNRMDAAMRYLNSFFDVDNNYTMTSEDYLDTLLLISQRLALIIEVNTSTVTIANAVHTLRCMIRRHGRFFATEGTLDTHFLKTELIARLDTLVEWNANRNTTNFMGSYVTSLFELYGTAAIVDHRQAIRIMGLIGSRGLAPYQDQPMAYSYQSLWALMCFMTACVEEKAFDVILSAVTNLRFRLSDIVDAFLQDEWADMSSDPGLPDKVRCCLLTVLSAIAKGAADVLRKHFMINPLSEVMYVLWAHEVFNQVRPSPNDSKEKMVDALMRFLVESPCVCDESLFSYFCCAKVTPHSFISI